jgi:hypothetical protein
VELVRATLRLDPALRREVDLLHSACCDRVCDSCVPVLLPCVVTVRNLVGDSHALCIDESVQHSVFVSRCRNEHFDITVAHYV